MNPIHEFGPASLILILAAAVIAFVPTLGGCVFGAFGMKGGARALLAVGALFAAAVCLIAALYTRTFHAMIDGYVKAGSYGPPALVEKQYAPEWQESATLSARVGLVAGGLVIAIAAIAWRFLRERGKVRAGEIAALVVIGAALAFCAVEALT